MDRAPTSVVGYILETRRAAKGWTYQRVRDEISLLGIEKSEPTVRFCIQGQAGTARNSHRSVRQMRKNGQAESSTLELVGAVLQVPPIILRKAWAADLLGDSPV